MTKSKYIVNRRAGGRVGIAASIAGAKLLIKRDGQLLTRYEVIRVTGRGAESRIGVYQNKSMGYRFGNRMVVERQG